MQMTHRASADSLNSGFLEAIKERFGAKEVEIIVKDVEDNKVVNQMETFHKLEKLRRKLKSVKIDPALDLSALANDVNL
ncbi:hypothetical protein GCM10028803_13650 [Larkinella knui]|uniref:Uncharacterized protein n=1 Tax=Larkinella knui TaxID=2025310 RepID=A0A3P1CBQ9_9BACT|nr:hypothetical protein [Larkinella knui]RRB10688.1 hypothetical protein EHT87_26370 [Larkinella knui]